jgi:DNA-binding response OmpR family regulator
LKAILVSDGSEFAKDQAAGLAGDLLELEVVERGEQLEAALTDEIAMVVVANPRIQSARIARQALDKAGGTVSNTPLIALLSDRSMVSELDALKQLDDFVVTPIETEELVGRAELVRLRRGLEGNLISSGELVINLDQHMVLLSRKPVDLTYKEFELLKTFASTPGRVYTREELLRNIWGYDYFGGTRTVDVHVRRVRSKIEHNRSYIETVHGVGYRFAAEPE